MAASLMLIILVGYVGIFFAFDAQMGLYKLSKQFATYDHRQYLGMSKRYLPQYAHMLFLFSLLLLSKYVFTSNKGKGLFDIVLKFTLKY